MVSGIAQGIVTVTGLPGAGFEELLKFKRNVFGLAFNLDEKEIGVVLLGEDNQMKAGDEVERTGRVMDIPVGNDFIGRIINPLGEPLDGKGPIAFTSRLPIESAAPAIMDRAPVTVPLQTGIKVVDALVPIGRGQRELILGDRQTGKTAIAIDAIVNQQNKNVICIYCAIGQRASSVAKVADRLNKSGAMLYTIIMVTEGNNAAGLQYIAPYAATTMGEYFMKQGRDVLIVYDDLSLHARAYRELSLLLRRPPGREAYPGDIFYLHARLLERATHLNDQNGGGSLTALPIVETEAQDISAYIPTNLISITDGQIYLSPKLFALGVLPAVDVGKSVSRVGGKAQLPAYRKVSGNLKLNYAQFEELETFARFGTRLDDSTRKIMDYGKRIRLCFKQPELQPVPVTVQIVLLLALTNDLFENIELEDMPKAEELLTTTVQQFPEALQERLAASEMINETDKETILSAIKKAFTALQQLPEQKAP